MRKLVLPILALLLLLSACGAGGTAAPPATPSPEPTPVPTPEPTPFVPDALIGEWTLCIGDGAVGDGSELSSFSIAPGAVFTANGESSVGRLYETEESDILNFVTADRRYLLRSVEKGGLALLYYDAERDVYTSASPQIFYRDYRRAELNAENWQDYFELKTDYELKKNSLGRVSMLYVRIYLVPKETLDVLAIRGGKVTAEVKPIGFALICFPDKSDEYSFSDLPKNKKELASYGSERLQYAESGFHAESEFHNFSMEAICGWAANIYARGDLEFRTQKDKSVAAAVEKDFQIEITSLAGTIFYREAS